MVAIVVVIVGGSSAVADAAGVSVAVGVLRKVSTMTSRMQCGVLSLNPSSKPETLNPKLPSFRRFTAPNRQHDSDSEEAGPKPE